MIIPTWVFFRDLISSYWRVFLALKRIYWFRFGRHGDVRLKTKMRGIQLKLWELINMASSFE